MLETRRLLKESKYKRIIIDESDKMIIEPYDSEPLSIYCDKDDNDNSNKMSTQSKDDDKEDEDDEMEDVKENEEDEERPRKKQPHKKQLQPPPPQQPQPLPQQEDDEMEDEIDIEEDEEDEEDDERPRKKQLHKKQPQPQQQPQPLPQQEDDGMEDEIDVEEDEEDEEDIEEDEEDEEDDERPRKKQPHKKQPQQAERKEDKKEINKNFVDIGQDLFALLKNINKLPTPPPTNNPKYTTEKYRQILINHLSKISSVNEFDLNLREIFMTVPFQPLPSLPSSLSSPSQPLPSLPSSSSFSQPLPSLSSQKSSLGFIMNEEYEDPSLLISLPINELITKQNQVCTFISNKIVNIYETTLKNQVQSEILRRCQFNNLILILEYYEKLEIFCNIHLVRTKGKTVKSQAAKMIAKSSKSSEEQPPRIKVNEITIIISQATRIRRLLKIASNDYNIFYAFPDLRPQLFLPKKSSVVNFERWLNLVETGELPSIEKGEQLYNEYKEKRRVEREKFLLEE